MKKQKTQSEFKYNKNSGHLPMFGVGPFYVWVIAILTGIAVLLDRTGVLPAVRPTWGLLLFIVLGAALIISGTALWIKAVLIDKLDKNIEENRLLTNGAYAIVRNPIYTAFALICSGALLINGNVLTFFLPLLYWLFMTVLIKNTEEKWLSERYGSEYEAYCRRVNRCIPGIPDKYVLYESDISDARWIAYDLPGNVGWIAYFTGLILLLINQVTAVSIISIIPAILMIVGIAELVSERIAKLDRILPKIRLYRGFGALMLGGALGIVTSAIALIIAVVNGNGCLHQIVMFVGAILCFILGGLLFKEYKRRK